MKQLTKDLIEWTRDYLNSFGGNTKVVIGISGGKDSSVVAAACVAAVGKDRVVGVLLPNGYQHDIDKARKVVSLLGIKTYEFNIKYTFDRMTTDILSTIEAFPSKSVSDGFKNCYSNTPARIRMTYLYGVAALLGDARVANTCNRSEDYVGYSTKYGDSAGDFAPLANLCVREVLEIGEDLGLPDDLVHKPPEDGLSGLTDEENLGFTYKTLDSYLLDGIKPPQDILENIEKRHKQNLHKITPMPSFKKGEIKMFKRVTIQFDVTIPDEPCAGELLSDEDVIEELKEAYNDFIRTEGCSDATIKIDTMDKEK